MSKPNLVIFASGEKPPIDISTAKGGGSGMKNLIEASLDGRLDANIVGVVCNIKGGGVEDKLLRIKEERGVDIPFVFFPKTEHTPKRHQEIVCGLGGEDCFVALSGCLWLVPMKKIPKDPEPGLDPRFVFNIHPGPLPHFGGEGMWGHYVHEAVFGAFCKKDLYDSRIITWSAVTMHFVTKRYDEGPVFFELPIPILPTDNAASLGKAVNIQEHRFQPFVTNEVVHRRICWDGKNKQSLVVPMGWEFLQRHQHTRHV